MLKRHRWISLIKLYNKFLICIRMNPFEIHFVFIFYFDGGGSLEVFLNVYFGIGEVFIKFCGYFCKSSEMLVGLFWFNNLKFINNVKKRR